ncbi:MAG: HD-GYP domain-containing protein [Dehalococcoidia bacterium]|nr:MAG: HD-GYP domain-containing protein [Dehalococcoidia bacterium]
MMGSEICSRETRRITTKIETRRDSASPRLRWLWVIGALTISATIAAFLMWQKPNPANYAASTVLLALLGILAFTAAGQALILTSRFRQSTLYIQEVEENYESLWQVMFSALDLRDGITGGHSSRVADLAVQLGQRLDMSDDEMEHLRWAAFLHDVGKLGVADDILMKPGPLSVTEWEQMRRHPAYGYSIVGRDGFLSQVAEIVYCHHERFDGRGYPRGLAGDEIPLGARVFAVADAYDAMTSDRPYRPALSHSQAIEEIQRNAGSQFDPRVVAAALQWARETSRSGDRHYIALPPPLPVTAS